MDEGDGRVGAVGEILFDLTAHPREASGPILRSKIRCFLQRLAPHDSASFYYRRICLLNEKPVASTKECSAQPLHLRGGQIPRSWIISF